MWPTLKDLELGVGDALKVCAAYLLYRLIVDYRTKHLPVRLTRLAEWLKLGWILIYSSAFLAWICFVVAASSYSNVPPPGHGYFRYLILMLLVALCAGTSELKSKKSD